MPELPEVETMRRGILGIVGSRIEQAARVPCLRKPILVHPSPAALQRRTAGRTIVDVGRIGKRVVVHLDSGEALVFEPRMTGLVLVADPPTVEHLRFQMTLSGGPVSQIWYWDRRGLGSVRLFTAGEFAAKFAGEQIGPDALSLTAEMLRGRLESSRRAIKVALLDQRAIAGVGNLYASEILHLAGVHPLRRCDLLTAEQWQAIFERLIEVLETAIRYEGSTLSDGTYRNALNQAGGYQSQHRVYDRAGEVCQSCQRGTIERIVQAQRATFFCPTCQTKRPPRKAKHARH